VDAAVGVVVSSSMHASDLTDVVDEAAIVDVQHRYEAHMSLEQASLELLWNVHAHVHAPDHARVHQDRWLQS